ncbi:pectinesterase family protein [Niabella hibiscisoli]|uniref:pectinesterase family protein n=1 Tax=Niabella hibiscisoli TaxID=1825928 RepID=UPI0021D44B9E|nr:pectinesterase family protein [Niabella hibiscisoli]
MIRLFLLQLLVLYISNSAFAVKPDFVVAKDGSGNFTTVQEAINAVPASGSKRTVIFIKNGIYKEKLTLPANKTNVSFVGEDINKVILTYDDYASKQNEKGANIGTTGSSSFFVYGDGFSAENITFENSAGPVGQAVAVRVSADRISFKNCRFLGFQDTLYVHGAALKASSTIRIAI